MDDWLEAQLRALLRERTGLDVPEVRREKLQAAVAHVMRDAGITDPVELVARLAGASVSSPLSQALVSAITIGETHFFRVEPQWRALEEQILPEVMARRRHTRRLRFWVAACATGEEAYSLAILLDRLLPDADAWEVSLLATDIDRKALAQARAGVYGERALRDTPASIRERYFREYEGRYVLIPRIREQVTLRYLNLVDSHYPDPTEGPAAEDVILCRNVLMYFSGPVASEVRWRLHQTLAPGGWLLVAPAEMAAAADGLWETVALAGTVVYRRPETGGVPSPRGVPSSPAARVVSATAADARSAPVRPRAAPKAAPRLVRPAPVEPAPVEPAPAPAPPPAVPAPGAGASVVELCDAARQALASGALDEAEALLAQAIALDRLCACAHYLLGRVAMRRGHDGAAEEHLQRAAYLDPALAAAPAALAELHAGEGHRELARRQAQIALRLLEEHPDETPVAEIDRAAGEVRARLRSLL